jgi:hypothetical protein
VPPSTYVPPRHVLPDEHASEIRDAAATRTDVRAVYWLTTLYESGDESIAQNEIHIELVDPPEEAASPEQARDLWTTIPLGFRVIGVISPKSILPQIRQVGLRIA